MPASTSCSPGYVHRHPGLLTCRADYLTIEPRDNASGQAVVEAKGVAHRQALLTHPQPPRLPQLYGLQLALGTQYPPTIKLQATKLG